MSLNLYMRESNGITIVDLSGRVTLGDGASALRETLHQLADSGRLQVLLNFANVSHIDSSGIGLLVASFATFNRLGGRLKLLSLGNRVKDVLVITKLYTVFDVYDAESTALRSFTNVAAPAAQG